MPHTAADKAERVLVHTLFDPNGATVRHTHLRYDPDCEPQVDLIWDPVTDSVRFYCRIEGVARADLPAVVGQPAGGEASALDDARVDAAASAGPLR